MPGKQVAHIVVSSKPRDAVAILTAMTRDRIATLLEEIPPAHLGAMMRAAGEHDKLTLLQAMSPVVRRATLSCLSSAHLTEIIAVLPEAIAWTALSDIPPGTAAGVYAELPEQSRRRMQASIPPSLPPALASAMYQRAAVETIVRTASRTAWLDECTGDVLAEVFGKSVHIAMRYWPRIRLHGEEVAAAARRANWTAIVGLLVLTNAELSYDARQQADAIQRTGHSIEIVQWNDAQDDGHLRRSLVRLAG